MPDYLTRFRSGEWRAPIFRDIVLNEMLALGPSRSLTVLDIGCGRGFDDEISLQSSLAAEAGYYVGVEPDSEIALNPVFTQVHRSLFEDASIPNGTIDVAFAVMVLEHLSEPRRFWDRLNQVLRPGGVFVGFTIDARHWFSKASRTTAALGIKDWYLDKLLGRRGEDRYMNYPVHYRCNTPRQVASCASHFTTVECTSFGRVGQMDYYLPRLLRSPSRFLDRIGLMIGSSGSILVVRAVK